MIAISSCAQWKPVVKKSYAYLLVTHAGMIAVDDNGNPRSNGVHTSHFIYIETEATATPQWEAALLNKNVYSVTAAPLSQKTLQVGFSKADEPIIIKPATGNKLWRIDLGEIIKNRKMEDYVKKQISAGSIILLGKMNNKSFTHTIANQTELRPIQGE